MDRTFAVAIGGAAGQGVATGDIFAKLFARRGLHINAYNAISRSFVVVVRNFITELM